MTQEALIKRLEISCLGLDAVDPLRLLVDDVIAALAQPEQEPVAMETVYETIIQWDEGGGKRSRRELARRIVALYTTPPQRTWVGLTEDERDHLTGLHLYAVRGQVEAWIEGVDDFAQAIEAKLKELNT